MNKRILIVAAAAALLLLVAATGPIINKISDINDARNLRTGVIADGQVPVWSSVSNRWFPGNLAVATNTAAGGSAGQVQLNAAGVLAGDSDLTFATDTLTATKLIVKSGATVTNLLTVVNPSVATIYSSLDSMGLVLRGAGWAGQFAYGTDTFSQGDSVVFMSSDTTNTLVLGYAGVGEASLTLPYNAAATILRGLKTPTVQVNDDAYAAGWNGSTNVPTKNAVYDQMELKSNISGPTFTGDPKAPTPAENDNDTSIATTAYVQTGIAGLVAGTGSSNITDSAYTAVIRNAQISTNFTTLGMLYAGGPSNVFTNMTYFEGGVTINGTGGSVFDAATVTNLNIITALTNSFLTATRVPFSSATKTLTDDADMTFATDTLTVTKLFAPTSVETVTLNTGSATVTNVATAGTFAAVTNVTAPSATFGAITVTNLASLGSSTTVPLMTVGSATFTNAFKLVLTTKTAPVSDATNWTVNFNEPSVYWVATNTAMHFSIATNMPTTGYEMTSAWRIANTNTNAVTITFNSGYFGTASSGTVNRLMLTNACTVATNSVLKLVFEAQGTNILTAWKDSER